MEPWSTTRQWKRKVERNKIDSNRCRKNRGAHKSRKGGNNVIRKKIKIGKWNIIPIIGKEEE